MAENAAASNELADKCMAEKISPYLRLVRVDGLDIIGAPAAPRMNHVSARSQDAYRSGTVHARSLLATPS